MDKHMPHLLVMYKVCASSPRRATEEPRRAEVPLPLPSPTGLASLSRPRARGSGRRWRRCPNQDAAIFTDSDSDCLLSSFSKKISCYFYGSSFCTLQVLGRRALTRRQRRDVLLSSRALSFLSFQAIHSFIHGTAR